MKLLNVFEKQVKAVGAIQKIWLTSFVIDVEFIETYLLPVVLGMDVPKLRMDFEAMQQELGARGIDFQVFCDKRFIEPDQNKRTAIPIHCVSPERLTPNGAVRFTKDSLFHPKVVYIQGEEGAVLGSGSANLTVSGWGRNREVFHFVPVASDDLAASVVDFFQPIFANVRQPFDWNLAPQQGESESQTAVFCSSVAGPLFLERLFGDVTPYELAAWSPYFPGDIASFITKLHSFAGNSSMKVQIVPDRVENRYLRARWSEGLGELHEKGLLSFHTSPLQGDDRLSMTHAKVWKTPNTLAIGSWNFTHPGANLPDGKDSCFNVEAGFILSDSSNLNAYLGKALELDPALFATSEQLKEERLFVPESLPFDLQVIFDWQVERYVISGTWVSKHKPEGRYELNLPGIDRTLNLEWSEETGELIELTLNVAETRLLLANHRYEVLLEGEPRSSGLIIEKRAEYRRAQQYEDLRGLFDALVLSRGEPSPDDVNYRVRETESGQVLVDSLALDGSDIGIEREGNAPDISYFRLFSACHHYAQIIESCTSAKDLEHWLFTRPGCLQELVEKTRARIEAPPESIFNWFLAQEVNHLCETGDQMAERVGLAKTGELSHRWQALDLVVPKLPESLPKDYRQWLTAEYHRKAQSWEVV